MVAAHKNLAGRPNTWSSRVESELSKINKQFKASIRYKPCSYDHLRDRDRCIAQNDELVEELRETVKDLMENAADTIDLDSQIPPLLVPLQDNVEAAEELKLKNKKDRDDLQKEKRKASKDKVRLDKRQNERKQRCKEEMEKFTKKFNEASAFEPSSLYYKILKDELIENHEFALKDYEENTEHLLIQTIDDKEFEAQLYQYLQELEEHVATAEDYQKSMALVPEIPNTSGKRKASRVQTDDFGSTFDDIHRQIKEILKFNPAVDLIDQHVKAALHIINRSVVAYRELMQNLVATQAKDKTFEDKLKECVDDLNGGLKVVRELASYNGRLNSIRLSAESAVDAIATQYHAARFTPCNIAIMNKKMNLTNKFNAEFYRETINTTLRLHYMKYFKEKADETEISNFLHQELNKYYAKLKQIVEEAEALNSLNENEQKAQETWSNDAAIKLDLMRKKFEEISDYKPCNAKQHNKRRQCISENKEAVALFQKSVGEFLWTTLDEVEFWFRLRDRVEDIDETITTAKTLRRLNEEKIHRAAGAIDWIKTEHQQNA